MKICPHLTIQKKGESFSCVWWKTLKGRQQKLQTHWTSALTIVYSMHLLLLPGRKVWDPGSGSVESSSPVSSQCPDIQ